MNVKVPLCRRPLSVILQDSKEVVRVPRCCHGWKGIMIPDAPGQEMQSILVCRRIFVLVFSTSAQAHVLILQQTYIMMITGEGYDGDGRAN